MQNFPSFSFRSLHFPVASRCTVCTSADLSPHAAGAFLETAGRQQYHHALRLSQGGGYCRFVAGYELQVGYRSSMANSSSWHISLPSWQSRLQMTKVTGHRRTGASPCFASMPEGGEKAFDLESAAEDFLISDFGVEGEGC
eukprot:g4608.t1